MDSNAAQNLCIDWVDIAYSRQIVAESALNWGCRVGNLRLVTLVAEVYRFTADEAAVVQRALLEACRAGNLNIAIWLKDRYSLTVADALKVLKRCCNQEEFKCLIDAFGLTSDDAREALKDACESENIYIVWTLLSIFEFPKSTIREARALVDGNKEIVDILDGVLSGKPSY